LPQIVDVSLIKSAGLAKLARLIHLLM